MELFHPATADVAFLIFDLLSLSSLVALRCTSRSADDLFSRYFGSRLREALKTFITHEDHFLAEMSTTSSIIFGASAVSIIARCSWISTELDLCTPHSYFAHLLGFLVGVERYEPVFNRSTTPSDDPVCDGFCVRLKRGDRVINLVRSGGQCPLQPLRLTWTTSHLCYISATTFSVAYPTLTDKHRAVLRATRLEDYWYPATETQELISTYRTRGFDIRTDAASWLAEDEEDGDCAGPGSENCPLTVRYMGDRHSVKGGIWPVTRVRPAAPAVDYVEKLKLVWWQGGVHYQDHCRGHGTTTEPSWAILPREVLGDRT